jgi:hypothetical protein
MRQMINNFNLHESYSDIMSFTDIAKYGKYYNPANLHYNNGTAVMCDRCKENKLVACIGYLDQDLCLPCADQISKTSQLPPRLPEECLTLMRANRFNPERPEPLVKMRTDRFNLDK